VASLAILALPFLLGAVLGVLARGPWRLGALVVLGLLLAFLLVLAAYLAAPSSYATSCGSECGEYLGRWWEPAVVFAVAVFGL